MKKNWYIIYSKPQYEKKIVAVCNKKKIENYFPLNKVNKQLSKKEKIIYEPLFISFIFVKTTAAEMKIIKKIDGVLSMMFWQDSLAIIKEEEIDAIKEFTKNHHNISIEPCKINIEAAVKSVSMAIKTADNNVYSINCKTVKVNLPSLGFTLIAEVNNNFIFGRSKFDITDSLLQQH